MIQVENFEMFIMKFSIISVLKMLLFNVCHFILDDFELPIGVNCHEKYRHVSILDFSLQLCLLKIYIHSAFNNIDFMCFRTYSTPSFYWLTVFHNLLIKL